MGRRRQVHAAASARRGAKVSVLVVAPLRQLLQLIHRVQRLRGGQNDPMFLVVIIVKKNTESYVIRPN